MKLKLEQVLRAVQADEGIGFCLACGHEQAGCEPDAQNYKCNECDENQVFGADEILLCGYVS